MGKIFPKFPLPLGDQNPHVTQCSMGPQRCLSQTRPRSVQSLLRREAELNSVTNRHTSRETDRKLTDVAIIGDNSLHLTHSMQPKMSSLQQE